MSKQLEDVVLEAALQCPDFLAFCIVFEAWLEICDSHECHSCPLMPCHGAICDACIEQGDGVPSYDWCPHYAECIKQREREVRRDE